MSGIFDDLDALRLPPDSIPRAVPAVCGNCWFWERREYSMNSRTEGACHYSPPQSAPFPDQGVSNLPVRDASSGCSKFRARPGEYAAPESPWNPTPKRGQSARKTSAGLTE